MLLADTSVWIAHLRAGDARLAESLDDGGVLTHPFVIGELACGNLRHRREVLSLLADLPAARVASDAEVLAMIDVRSLMGRGIGYVDAHLLAATAITPDAVLLTYDKRLARIADSLGLRAS